MERKTLDHKLHTFFSNQPDVALAYLFGSRVDEDSGPLSDIDVGLLLEHAKESEAVRARLSHELGKALGSYPLDLVLLRQAPVELAYAVISQGVCIFQRDLLTRVEFEAQVLSRYGDYLPVLREQRADILQGKGNARRVQRYREALRRTERTLSQIAPTDP